MKNLDTPKIYAKIKKTLWKIPTDRSKNQLFCEKIYALFN